jgi:hypothetical protein
MLNLPVYRVLGATIALLAGCTGPIGPLAETPPYDVGFPVNAGEAITWGTPFNAANGTLTLVSVDLIDVRGIDVLGVTGCEGSPMVDGVNLSCAPGVAYGWPQHNARAVEGTDIGSAPEESGSIMVGVSLPAGTSEGTIGRMRISYTAEGVAYSVTQPWSLHLRLK